VWDYGAARNSTTSSSIERRQGDTRRDTTDAGGHVSKAATDMVLAETGFFSKNWIWRRVLTFEGSLGRREDSFIRDARLCVCRYTETYFYFVRCTSIFCDILTLHRGFTRSCHDPQRSYLVFPHLLSYLNRPTCGRANSLPMLQVPASSLSLSPNHPSTMAPRKPANKSSDTAKATSKASDAGVVKRKYKRVRFLENGLIDVERKAGKFVKM
jgi:hypothetical protein